MTRTAEHTIWARLRRAWLESATPADPRLAAEAGMAPAREKLRISPLVGAWLR